MQTNGGFFYVPSPSHDRLMIPTKYLEELKNAPDSKADFTGSFVEASFVTRKQNHNADQQLTQPSDVRRRLHHYWQAMASASYGHPSLPERPTRYAPPQFTHTILQ